MIKRSHPNNLRRSEIVGHLFQFLGPELQAHGYHPDLKKRSFILQDRHSHKEIAFYLVNFGNQHYLDLAFLCKIDSVQELFRHFEKAGGSPIPAHTAASNFSVQSGLPAPIPVGNRKGLEAASQQFIQYLIPQGMKLMQNLTNQHWLEQELNREMSVESQFVNQRNRPFTATVLSFLAQRETWKQTANRYLDLIRGQDQSLANPHNFKQLIHFLERKGIN